MNSQTIEVKYKCTCLLTEVSVAVPARRGPAHDVTYWLSTIVAGKISEDHKKRSPECRATVMDQVKIPMSPEDDYLGQVR